LGFQQLLFERKSIEFHRVELEDLLTTCWNLELRSICRMSFHECKSFRWNQLGIFPWMLERSSIFRFWSPAKKLGKLLKLLEIQIP